MTAFDNISSNLKDGYRGKYICSTKLGLLVSWSASEAPGISMQTWLKLKKLNFLLMYKFSQDHLELFFDAIRTAGGWNNNPTPEQSAFISAQCNQSVER